MAGVRPEARWVRFVSLDGYDVPSVEDALVDGAIVALELNGEPLPIEIGLRVARNLYLAHVIKRGIKTL